MAMPQLNKPLSVSAPAAVTAESQVVTLPEPTPEDVTVLAPEPVEALEPEPILAPAPEPTLHEQFWDKLLADMPTPVKTVLWELNLTLDTLLQCRPSQLRGSLNDQQIQLINSWLKSRGLCLTPDPVNVTTPPRPKASPATTREGLLAKLARFRKIRKA
jgi:hypothetical protein